MERVTNAQTPAGGAMTGSGDYSLSDEELDFYSRQIVMPLIGYEGQLRLRRASVCIAGVGGLGSPAAMQLAAMGVGRIRLVDYDVVERSNLQRQHLYDVNSVGYPKVEIAARRLRGLNPYVQVEPLPWAIGDHNAQEIIAGMDVLVDGLDHMSPRYALNRACLELRVPYVFGAAVSTYGTTSTIVPGESACLECLFGTVSDDALPSCSILGVHPSILSLVASIEVSEAIRVLLGQKPRLANRILYCDIEALEFEQTELSRADDCPACGPSPTPSSASPEHRLVTELCSRDGERTFAVLPKGNLALDLGQVDRLLEEKGFPVHVRADLGRTFRWRRSDQASLLVSGVMIVQGASTDTEARSLFQDLVVEGLGIPLADSDQRRGDG
jgi:molybdopterin/thiamine biosynthesis adenylyltransferase